MLQHRKPLVATLFASLLLLAPAGWALAAPMDVPLSFASLPSAQGWTYSASGSHAGVAEATVYSVSGGTLFQNTMGQYMGVNGGGILYLRNNGITTTETKRIHVRARCLAQQGAYVAPQGEGGLIFGFATGSVQYAFGLTTGAVTILGPGGTSVVATTSNMQFRDYDFEWAPGGSFQLYRDGVLVHSGSGGFALAANRLLIGDGTGGANAQGEITEYRFSQDLATPALPASWGRIKGLYSGR